MSCFLSWLLRAPSSPAPEQVDSKSPNYTPHSSTTKGTRTVVTNKVVKQSYVDCTPASVSAIKVGGYNGDSAQHHGHHDSGGPVSTNDCGGWDGGGWDCGGCFSGDSEVHMSDGTRKLVKNLVKGDRVLCEPSGKMSEVVCLLVMETPSDPIPVVVFPEGLKITPRHLIFMDGKWTKACDRGRAHLIKCRYVYNIMLNHDSTVIVNGVTCITLGHGKQGEVQHEFWGNWDRLTRTMGEIDPEGFEHGQVHVGGTIRDTTTGRVCGFRKPTRVIHRFPPCTIISLHLERTIFRHNEPPVLLLETRNIMPCVSRH